MTGINYKILPTKEFSNDFKKLDGSVKGRIKLKIEEVSQDPTRYKHLSYDLKGSCRIRIGKLRIIFSYSEKLMELYLEKIVFDHQYRE